jgi:hypothetical protein
VNDTWLYAPFPLTRNVIGSVLDALTSGEPSAFLSQTRPVYPTVDVDFSDDCCVAKTSFEMVTGSA